MASTSVRCTKLTGSPPPGSCWRPASQRPGWRPGPARPESRSMVTFSDRRDKKIASAAANTRAFSSCSSTGPSSSINPCCCPYMPVLEVYITFSTMFRSICSTKACSAGNNALCLLLIGIQTNNRREAKNRCQSPGIPRVSRKGSIPDCASTSNLATVVVLP